jgi:K+-sensing histidine kinase KdpD
LVSLLLAALIVTAFSILRAGLTPELDENSPYMLYVAAVLVAGFARGGFCGLLVLIGGGLAGFYLFADPQNTWAKTPGALASLGLFWLVGGLVLLAARELRNQVNDTFTRFRQRLDAEGETRQGG